MKSKDEQIKGLKSRIKNLKKSFYLANKEANEYRTYRSVCLELYDHITNPAIGAIDPVHVLKKFVRVMK